MSTRVNNRLCRNICRSGIYRKNGNASTFNRMLPFRKIPFRFINMKIYAEHRLP